jgi:hypothetical protein
VLSAGGKMKVRIKPISFGSLAIGTWERRYRIEIKTFLFWNRLGDFETMEHCKEFISKIKVFRKITYED